MRAYTSGTTLVVHAQLRLNRRRRIIARLDIRSLMHFAGFVLVSGAAQSVVADTRWWGWIRGLEANP